MSVLPLVAAQEQFLATLKAVEDAVRLAFRRHLRPQVDEEGRAAARGAWYGP